MNFWLQWASLRTDGIRQTISVTRSRPPVECDPFTVYRIGFELLHNICAAPGVNEFYKKGCQEKSSASTGGAICFSRSSPLKFRFSGEAWLIAHARKFPARTVAMLSSSKER